MLCGTAWFEAAILQIDPQARIVWHVRDGERCAPNQVVVEMHGQARALLSAERTALNFLQLLSAVATKTATYVAQVAGTRAHIVDTRKTLPGLRLAQKYAVRVRRRRQPPHRFVRRCSSKTISQRRAALRR